MKRFAGILIAYAVTGCGGGGPADPAIAPTQASSISVSRQIEIEDRLVSAFENSTLVIQYDYIENLDDGRGFTAGRAGFTSGTGDMLEVVKEYNRLSPNNVLTPFQTALEKVNGTASILGLEGIVQAWRDAAKDPKFLTAQDNINDLLYRQTARQQAERTGAKLALSKVAIYEAGIQHGYGDDFDSINKIIDRASTKAGGTPKDGVDEKIWLKAVLEERRKDLLAPADTATAKAWADSVSRADAMLQIYRSGNVDLDKPINITVYGQSFSI